LKAGLIVKSKSRYPASYFYIPKKDRSLQLVQDYRKLNQVIIKNKTLLPLYHKINYSLVVMLELNGVSEVQYKEIIIIGDE